MGIESAPIECAHIYSPDYDLQICESSVGQLQDIVRDAIKDKKSLILVESEHRLLHYLDRLRRIKPRTPDD